LCRICPVHFKAEPLRFN